MPRLYKFALIGFFAYALVTATPAQQTEIGRGLVAVKDAAIDACSRKDSLCTRAIEWGWSTLSSTLSDDPAPWMDERSKRGEPSPEARQAPPPRSTS